MRDRPIRERRISENVDDLGPNPIPPRTPIGEFLSTLGMRLSNGVQRNLDNDGGNIVDQAIGALLGKEQRTNPWRQTPEQNRELNRRLGRPDMPTLGSEEGLTRFLRDVVEGATFQVERNAEEVRNRRRR